MLGGPELHSPLVPPRRQQLDDVDALVEKRPGAVGHPAHVFQALGLRPLGDVGAVDLAEPGGVGEGLVAAAHRVGEHLDAGAGDLLDVAAGLLRGERRLEGYVGRRVAVGIEDQSGAVRRSFGVGGFAQFNAPLGQSNRRMAVASRSPFQNRAWIRIGKLCFGITVERGQCSPASIVCRRG